MAGRGRTDDRRWRDHGDRRSGRCRRPLRFRPRRRAGENALLIRPCSHEQPLQELFEDQLACADMIVLNKIDGLDERGLGAVSAELAARSRPEVKVVMTVRGALDPRVALGIHAAAEAFRRRAAGRITTTRRTTITTSSSASWPNLGPEPDPAIRRATAARDPRPARRAAGQGLPRRSRQGDAPRRAIGGRTHRALLRPAVAGRRGAGEPAGDHRPEGHRRGGDPLRPAGRSDRLTCICSRRGRALSATAPRPSIFSKAPATSSFCPPPTARSPAWPPRARAWRSDAGFPSLRLASLLQLGHPLSVDLYVDKTLAHAKLVIVRLLGGRSYWSYGVEQVGAACRQGGIPLALLPGDDQPDAELAQLSTAPHEAQHRLWRYLVEGGIDNAVELLRYAASAHWLRTFVGGASAAAARRPLRARRAGSRLRAACPAARSDAPVAALVFYRALVQAGNLAVIDALVDALASAGLNPLPVWVTSLKDPLSAATLTRLLADAPPDIVLNATGFAVATPGRGGERRNGSFRGLRLPRPAGHLRRIRRRLLARRHCRGCRRATSR